jgi:hypothetical protein
LVEPPFLSLSGISCLDSKVGVVDQVEVSVVWELRDNVEWSFNIEAEFFIQLSLLWRTLPFVSIDKIKLLVKSTMLLVYDDLSIFSI